MGIKEIAGKAGVSISTVSRILNGTKAVSPELMERVIRIIEEDGYVPNHAARSMVLRRTSTVGLVIPKISWWFQISAFIGMSSIFEKQGYQVLVVPIDASVSSEILYINLLKKKEIDGIVLMHETSNPEVIEFLSGSGLPIVLCTIDMQGLDFPVVGIDDYMAARDAVQYLISLGHRNIGMIRGSDFTVGDRRTAAFKDALASRGIVPSPQSIVTGNYTMESGRTLIHSLLQKNPSLSAVFCASDEMAIGVLRGASELGRRVPEDLSVLGFDGIESGRYSIPSLTTIEQPLTTIGEKAAELLIAHMRSLPIAERRITVPHSLVIRESCAPLYD
ncbi:LacI family DNA-binding transcriptional regulator [Treponema sp.]